MAIMQGDFSRYTTPVMPYSYRNKKDQLKDWSLKRDTGNFPGKNRHSKGRGLTSEAGQTAVTL